ncbi:MAG: bifunctional phosphoribosylaminoimidazolecarboxamide formyltransferase/IMP cyclohydrolase [Candidatus Cloacimonetes bacterium]|nr:bifunctional phosphoribosylaminoimidazolecarboxamide formyltransferase/IMP cyclohydrolase [Candidatus Cloacimonadota bacterium]
MDLIKIKRALISVSDKTSLENLVAALQSFSCEIIATGRTRDYLLQKGYEVIDISRITGNPEAFSGRMKTLSFQIGAAILFDRERDGEEAVKLGITPIDLVVCNLYPFARAKEKGAALAELIENIDIGGPTLIRAAAKNFHYVCILSEIDDYKMFLKDLSDHKGAVSYETRFYLMRKAFNVIADYDGIIAETMDERGNDPSLRLCFEKALTLRYGENSHQQGFLFRQRGMGKSLYDLELLHGRELSYNNISDINSAVNSLKGIPGIACSIVKHNNPCGIASGINQHSVLKFAWEGDPVSAFGSVIAFNSELTLESAEFFQLNALDKSKRKFIEVITAPSFNEDALRYLQFHENLRLIRYDPSFDEMGLDYRFLANSLLMQDRDGKLYNSLEFATKERIALKSWQSLIEFGLNVVRQIKSNAICIVREVESGYMQLLGMGAGQPNRLISTRLALEKSRDNLLREFHAFRNGAFLDQECEDYCSNQLAKSILLSDAFFPFPDNVEIAAANGIKIIVQPGGSLRDKKVIKRADELGICMIFTGIRHFRH